MPNSSPSEISEFARTLEDATPSRAVRILAGILIVGLVISGFAVVGTSFAISDDQQADSEKDETESSGDAASKNTVIGPDGKPTFEFTNSKKPERSCSSR